MGKKTPLQLSFADFGTKAAILAPSFMSDMTVVAYPQLKARIIPALTSKNKVDEIRLANELAGQFRAQYLKAAELARAKR